MKFLVVIFTIFSITSCKFETRKCQTKTDCFLGEVCVEDRCVRTTLRNVDEDLSTISENDLSSDSTGIEKCNNGQIDEGEKCDGQDLAGLTCLSEGFDKGTLSCNSTCDALSTKHCYSVYNELGAGFHHSCAIKKDGTLICWGPNSLGQIDSPPGFFQKVSVGADFSCALKKTGEGQCWGYNSTNQTAFPGGTFSQVSSGEKHSCN